MEREVPIELSYQNLNSSHIIWASVNKIALPENARRWGSVHRKICKNVIKRYSVDYLIKNSIMMIIDGEYHEQGFIHTKSLGITMKCSNINFIFKDIKNLLGKTGDTLQLMVKLQDGTQHEINL